MRLCGRFDNCSNTEEDGQTRLIATETFIPLKSGAITQ